MSTKTSQGGKGATRSPTEAAASRDQASRKQVDMLSAEEEDELPLIWQKMSNKLLQSFNERFDKFELTTNSASSLWKLHSPSCSRKTKSSGPSFGTWKGDPGGTT
ncbi:hypothetical protein PAMP_022840 [Pampus punctatissimus]